MAEDEEDLGVGNGMPIPWLEYFLESRSRSRCSGDRGGVLSPRSRSVNDMTMYILSWIDWAS